MRKSSFFVLTLLSILVVCAVYSACQTVGLAANTSSSQKDKIKLKRSLQRTGNIKQGQEYLLNGDFIDSGFPVNGAQGDQIDVKDSAFTTVTNEDGISMIAPNCLQCHGDSLQGEYIIGLPNTHFDFTVDMSFASQFIKRTLRNQHGEESKEWKAAHPFIRAMETVSPHIQTEVVGANPADKLAAVLASHRHPEDLSWNDDPLLDIPTEVVPADPPAWWLLKYKQAMFATGIGRGDFARLMMASSLLTLTDTVSARKIDDQFVHVKDYIESLEAPKFTGNIDEQRVHDGRILFEDHCQKCHGTSDDYPNYLVDLSVIKTDSLLIASNFAYPNFINWYNKSWFNKGKGRAWLEKGNGYVAPPLVGIWATAPYLHNGSVPTVYHMLNSKARPNYWTKSNSSYAIDEKNLGWEFREFDSKIDKYCYDTTLPGYGNHGHNFGDKLTDPERYSVIEYLKTL